jgi:hypothetical protein
VGRGDGVVAGDLGRKETGLTGGPGRSARERESGLGGPVRCARAVDRSGLVRAGPVRALFIYFFVLFF